MSLVIDASVAAKWVIDEEGSDHANALRSEPAMIAPALIAIEIGSALWKGVQRNRIKRADAELAMRLVLLPFEALVAVEDLYEAALRLALDLRHSIYDCFYIALAQRERAELATADEKMAAAAKRAKVKVRKI